MRKVLAFILAMALSSGAVAQSVDTPAAGAILFVNQERLLVESELGKRILAEETSERAALSAEGEAIATQLEADELALTELRQQVPPEEFRQQADAFNLRVEQIRAEQFAKDQAQAAKSETRRRAFFNIAGQVLGDILRQSRASAIMDRRAVLLFDTGLEVTDQAIVALDLVFAANPDLIQFDQQQ